MDSWVLIHITKYRIGYGVVCVYIHHYVYSSLSQVQPLRGPRSSNTPVALDTSSAQILVSKCHSPLKVTRHSHSVFDQQSRT